MADVQQIVPADQLQAPGRQQQHLAHGHQVDLPHALQAGLHDLLKAPGDGRGPVHILAVIHLLQTAPLLGVLHNGEGHVRLQRHQPPVGVGKGQDILADQKALVLNIEVVGFKLAHLVLNISIAAVQLPQLAHHPFTVQRSHALPPSVPSTGMGHAVSFMLYHSSAIVHGSQAPFCTNMTRQSEGKAVV